MNRQPTRGFRGWPYAAVGMHRALHSAIGLPRRPTRASWMLGFLMPADVRRNFTGTPMLAGVGVVLLAAHSGRISMETRIATKTHRPRPDPFSLLQASLPNTGASGCS